ncbi:MAG: trigger factor, partial [Treponema sp.]|nr:trigger factor [Treponema sp.]
SIRTRLEKSLALRIKDAKISRLLEKIMENTPVILPESMVKAEISRRIRNMAQRFGTDADGILRMMAQSGKDPGEIEESWRSQAEKDLHSRLIIETIIENEHLEAGDGEMEEEFKRIADDMGSTVEDAKSQYGDENGLEYVRDCIKESKVFDLLLANNTIKTGPRTNYLDFMTKNG